MHTASSFGYLYLSLCHMCITVSVQKISEMLGVKSFFYNMCITIHKRVKKNLEHPWQWHPCQHWEDIHTSWRKDIVTHSWDQISFHSESSVYGTVFQVSKWGGVCSVSECFQGKVGQALERLLFFTGSRRFCSKITSDQPKGLPGLMARAEDKDKGKGRGYAEHWASSLLGNWLFVTLLAHITFNKSHGY